MPAEPGSQTPGKPGYLAWRLIVLQDPRVFEPGASIPPCPFYEHSPLPGPTLLLISSPRRAVSCIVSPAGCSTY